MILGKGIKFLNSTKLMELIRSRLRRAWKTSEKADRSSRGKVGPKTELLKTAIRKRRWTQKLSSKLKLKRRIRSR